MELQNTPTLITGASRGLGAALARTLGKQGARLVLVGRDRSALDEVVRDIRTAGGEAHGIVEDVGHKDAIHRIAGEAAALVGPVDLLIHNASTLGKTPLPLLLDTECEDLQRVLDVNLVGPFRLTKALAGSMALRGRGLVVNISSDAAIGAYPRWGAYSASKAALDHMGRIWAAELANTGVRVLSVDPGEMDTQMHADAMPDADRSTLARPEPVAARIASMIRETKRWESGARLEASRWEASP
ncbi:MAG: SDR family oxidoreductase [Deltaproteobacteria bacterium]|nr:SDR family oxidoreductase [Deltaproteobacteria bacterium]